MRILLAVLFVALVLASSVKFAAAYHRGAVAVNSGDPIPQCPYRTCPPPNGN